MREIKFRAWVKNENRMETCIELSPFHVGDCDRFRWNHDEVELMQYTGLKDKNGKEIYEGDILQVGKEYAGTHYPTYVIFEDGSFKHQISHMHNSVVLNEAKVVVLEVIGNIYENPELVKS